MKPVRFATSSYKVQIGRFTDSHSCAWDKGRNAGLQSQRHGETELGEDWGKMQGAEKSNVSVRGRGAGAQQYNSCPWGGRTLLTGLLPHGGYFV